MKPIDNVKLRNNILKWVKEYFPHEDEENLVLLTLDIEREVLVFMVEYLKENNLIP